MQKFTRNLQNEKLGYIKNTLYFHIIADKK